MRKARGVIRRAVRVPRFQDPLPPTTLGKFVFVVPMPPNITNRARGSTHWTRSYKEKHAYWRTLDTLLLCGEMAHHLEEYQDCSVPPSPTAPLARVLARSTMHLGAAMDDDNALARHKPLLDWLKTRGYIVDDRKKNIVWEGLPSQVVKRDGNYRIELTLTPLHRRAGTGTV